MDKSPENLWFYYSVIILYSSSPPTLLSSARSNDKSNQQEASVLREDEHKPSLRNTFLFLLSLFTVFMLLYCCFHRSYVVLSKFLSSWFVIIAAAVLFLPFVFSLFMKSFKKDLFFVFFYQTHCIYELLISFSFVFIFTVVDFFFKISFCISKNFKPQTKWNSYSTISVSSITNAEEISSLVSCCCFRSNRKLAVT